MLAVDEDTDEEMKEKEMLYQRERIAKIEEKIIFFRMATIIMEMPFFKELMDKVWKSKTETKDSK